MRRDAIRSARGEVVDFDALIKGATTVPRREIPKTAEVREARARRMNAYIVPTAEDDGAPEEAPPADAAMITATFKKKAVKQP